MVFIRFSLGLHTLFQYVLVLESAGNKTVALHFLHKEDVDDWFNYLFFNLETVPVYTKGVLTGLEIQKPFASWVVLATNVSMSLEGERDCELVLEGPNRDLFFYFTTRADKQNWIHNNLRKLKPAMI